MTKTQQLPPLTWIRAFCEAGRQGSFKEAANQLGVSPSTISHEVRKLEDWINAPLFDRSGRSITLTEEGQNLLAAVSPAFDRLAAAFQAFGRADRQTLRIGMFPFLASEVFVPRLPRLENVLSGHPIKIASTNHIADLRSPDPSERLDAVIRYGIKPIPGFHCVELTKVSLVPVVAGHLADGDVPAAGLKRIQMDNAFDGWKLLEDAGVSLPPAAGPSVVVDNYVSGLRAVEQGVGIGIGLLPLAATWIADGRIRPWSETQIHIPEKYWFVSDKSSAHRKLLDRIAVWLKEELTSGGGP